MSWKALRNSRALTFGAFAFCMAVTICAIFYVAFSLSAAHIVNRFGALVSSLGAIFVVFQVMREMKHDSLNTADEGRMSSGLISPANQRLAHESVRRRLVARRIQRLDVVIMVATVVFLGETLHGWGDLLYAFFFVNR
jgi:hypothetical protein